MLPNNASTTQALAATRASLTGLYSLQFTPDDPAATYVVCRAGQRIGEIRPASYHHAHLHLGRQMWTLQHDEAAAVAAVGGQLLRRLVAEVRPTRTWSLRADGQVQARASRRWHWRPAQDHLQLWVSPNAAPVAASAPGITRDLAIRAESESLGRMHITGWRRDQVELEWSNLDPARAALFMYAMHRAYGRTAQGEGGD